MSELEEPSACSDCGNRAICAKIHRRLGELDLLCGKAPSKSFDNIRLHLIRNGFNYPKVPRATHCWIFDKTAVAIFYENKLEETFAKSKSRMETIRTSTKFIA